MQRKPDPLPPIMISKEMFKAAQDGIQRRKIFSGTTDVTRGSQTERKEVLPMEDMGKQAQKEAMVPQKPSTGRIVYVVTHAHEGAGWPSVIRPAIITDVYLEAKVSLQVFYKHGIQAWDSVPYSADLTPGHWSWPPRV